MVDGYRRVIRPELSKTGTCGLCVAASDQFYSVENLMPIHPGCNCAVLPVIDGYDPGDYVNSMDLRRLYETAETGAEPDEYGRVPSRSQLSTVRVTIDQHGEYGPMLKNRDEHEKQLSTMVDATRDQRKMNFQATEADIEMRYREAVVKHAAGKGPASEVADYEAAIQDLRGRRKYDAQRGLVDFADRVG